MPNERERTFTLAQERLTFTNTFTKKTTYDKLLLSLLTISFKDLHLAPTFSEARFQPTSGVGESRTRRPLPSCSMALLVGPKIYLKYSVYSEIRKDHEKEIERKDPEERRNGADEVLLQREQD